MIGEIIRYAFFTNDHQQNDFDVLHPLLMEQIAPATGEVRPQWQDGSS